MSDGGVLWGHYRGCGILHNSDHQCRVRVLLIPLLLTLLYSCFFSTYYALQPPGMVGQRRIPNHHDARPCWCIHFLYWGFSPLCAVQVFIIHRLSGIPLGELLLCILVETFGVSHIIQVVTQTKVMIVIGWWNFHPPLHGRVNGSVQTKPWGDLQVQIFTVVFIHILLFVSLRTHVDGCVCVWGVWE